MDQLALAAGRCYACFRPAESCFCASIPRIDNRIEVLILQHRRERFHRFNTARIVHQALRNSQLLVDRTDNLARRLRLKPHAGLLYPGPGATLISDLQPAERPQQLVVVDGTWHHTKTLVRDIPALRSLPRYQLAPSSPSRYRIRLEPNDAALSTVEATVAALRVLEPETAGLELLLTAFEKMVDTQLAHPGSVTGLRFKARPSQTVKNIPLALVRDLGNIVVAYGESAPGERGRKKTAEPPISWVAQRLGDGESFACTLIPPHPLSTEFLGHLELTPAHFTTTALTIGEARARWAQFARPDDVVTVLHPGTARLLTNLTSGPANCLVLKAVDLESIPRSPIPLQLSLPPLGRATKRLAESIAVVLSLNALVRAQRAAVMAP